jgi:hypothetical protein
MIGYNRLGSNGRLGNQMFQYAALRGIAAKRKYNWVIPPENYNHTDNYGLFETFEMKNVKESNLGFVNGQFVEENDYCFIPEFFDECPDNVSLEGYFQTEKYFSHIENEIREDFTFKKEYLEPCKEYIESLDTPPIFLHVRQLDNIGREEYHPILPISFFEEALSNFRKAIGQKKDGTVTSPNDNNGLLGGLKNELSTTLLLKLIACKRRPSLKTHLPFFD